MDDQNNFENDSLLDIAKNSVMIILIKMND